MSEPVKRKRVVVFGGSGFIGSHVVEQFVLADYEVVSPLRPTSGDRFLKTLSCQRITVDFAKPESYAAIINAGDIVCNCIATTDRGASQSTREAVEIDLSKTLYDLSADAGASQFIQLSTVMVYGFGRPSIAIDESFVPQPEYLYGQIALKREQALEESARRSDLPLYIVRPTNTLGARDHELIPNFLRKGQLMVPKIGNKDWRYSAIDTRDIGRGFVFLSQSKAAPGHYLLKGFDCSWQEFSDAMASIYGIAAKRPYIPKTVLMFLARVIELITARDKTPALTPFAVAVISNDTLFDDTKIRTLGFTPKYDLPAAIEDYKLRS
jgi:nucleoside-diphosphate-sugar epimerase